MGSNVRTTALRWLKMGVAPIPLKCKSKEPLMRWAKYQTQLPTKTQVEQWFMPGYRNLAIVTGWKGLTVIDCDLQEVYYSLLVVAGPMDTFTVSTARGVHIYYWVDDCPTNMSLPGIDIKGQWGYVLTPPSIHPSGIGYKVLEDRPIARIQTLGDVLPSALLVPSNTEKDPMPIVIGSDPFVSAMGVIGVGVEEIKGSYRIEDFFPDRVPGRNGGRWWVARCPFHDDKHPSFWIDVENQVCGCHACKMKPMDVINLYARLHGVNNDTAIRLMARV